MAADNDIVEYVDQKFRSGNSVPIERAHLSVDEWAQLRAEIVRLRGEVDKLKILMAGLTLSAAIAPAEAKGGDPLDYVLPCDVAVAPATKISKGVRLGTLLSAIRLREGDGPQFTPGAGFRELFNTPQPAGGEAVATVCAAARARFGPAAHPHAVADWIEEQFRATPPAAQVQQTDERGRPMTYWGGAPALVQAAPQEGDRKLAEEGLWLFERNGDAGDKLYVEAIRRLLAAHPSACELGQRLSDYLCGLAENGVVTLDPFDSNSIDAIVAALQHRGDSRGGEG